MSGSAYKILTGLMFAAMLMVFGCEPRASEGGFHSDNPAAKLYAIRQAGEDKDPAAIPDLVEQLDSDDPAVRMFAIQALEQITDTRLGYNPYDSIIDRQSAIERWVEAAEEGRFSKQSITSSQDASHE